MFALGGILISTDFSAAAPGEFIAMFCLGVFQLGMGYVFLTNGLETTPPIVASLTATIEAVLNPTLVAIFYKEMLSTMSICGAVLVLVSSTAYNIIKGKSNGKAKQG